MTLPHILYIEDNQDNRILIERILTAEGMQFTGAPNGPSGLKLAQANPPDLILMDINLPNIDGYEVTGQFRAIPKLKHTPIVALTANVLKGDKEKALMAGCNGYIQKPIDVDRLPSQIQYFLKGA